MHMQVRDLHMHVFALHMHDPDSLPSVTITYMSVFICPQLYAKIKLLVLTCKQWDYFIAYLYDSNFVTKSMESLFLKSGTRLHA